MYICFSARSPYIQIINHLSSAEKNPCFNCSSTPTLYFVLAGYGCTIEYRNTSVHSSADSLFRLPLDTEIRNEVMVDPVGFFNLMQCDPLSQCGQRLARLRDPVLAQVYEMTSKG